jgi:hypothetical protein
LKLLRYPPAELFCFNEKRHPKVAFCAAELPNPSYKGWRGDAGYPKAARLISVA